MHHDGSLALVLYPAGEKMAKLSKAYTNGPIMDKCCSQHYIKTPARTKWELWTIMHQHKDIHNNTSKGAKYSTFTIMM